MDLRIQMDTASSPGGDRHAWAICVHDTMSARVVYETARLLADEQSPSPHLAAYRALLEALRFAVGHNEPADQVNLVTGSQRLANQITGIEPVQPPELETLHEQAMMSLLMLDSWTITAGDADAVRSAAELAQKELATGDSASPAGEPPVAGFTAELTDEPGRSCPAQSRSGVRYAFGPDTPGGLCLFAAAAVFSQGPPYNTDTFERTEQTVQCRRCGVEITLRPNG